jgi:hypothetical protein
MSEVTVQSLEAITSPRMQERINSVRQYWEEVDPYYGITEILTGEVGSDLRIVQPTDKTSRAFILEPHKNQADKSFSLVLALPYLNGFTPHHYIRAETLRQIVNPNGRVVVLPENSYSQKDNVGQFNDADTARLLAGDNLPYGERQMQTLEYINKTHNLGNIALTGYSKGGLTVMAMAAAGSDKLTVTHLNADEMPSKSGRDSKGLQKDFMKSGGILDLRRAIKESEIEPLSVAMSGFGMVMDLIKFGLASKSKNGKLMGSTMVGSADYAIELAQERAKDAGIKVGFVEGSQVFSPSSLSPRTIKALGGLVKYAGRSFHKHPTADNVIVHALMVNDCLVRA